VSKQVPLLDSLSHQHHLHVLNEDPTMGFITATEGHNSV